MEDFMVTTKDECVQLKVELVDGAELPSYAHEGDAAFDLRNNEEGFILSPGQIKVFKTGLKMEIPKGYFGSIRDRSGLAAKNGIHVLAGVIDSSYRGEIGVVLKNLGISNVKIEKGMRIAQMIIQPIMIATFEQIKSVEETKRNEGGFGSTGTK